MSIVSQKSCRVKYGYMNGTLAYANFVQMGTWVVPYYVGDYNGVGSASSGITTGTVYQRGYIIGYTYNIDRITAYQGIVTPHPTNYPICVHVGYTPSTTYLTQAMQYLYDVGIVNQSIDSSYNLYVFEFYNDTVYYVIDRSNKTLTAFDSSTDAQLYQASINPNLDPAGIDCPFPIYGRAQNFSTGATIVNVVYGEDSNGTFKVYHLFSYHVYTSSDQYMYSTRFDDNTSQVDSTMLTYIESSVQNALNETYDISSDCLVNLTPGSYAYTGSAIEPEPVITNLLTGNTLVRNTDYILSYSDNVNLGTASILITGANQYSGAVSVTFIIYSSDNPYDPSSGGSTGGGSGTFDDSSDDIDFATLPTVDAVNTNFITIYVPTLAQLQSISAYLWTTNFLTNLEHLFADPIDAIIGLQIIPVAVSYSTGVCKIGNVDTQISCNIADAQYVIYDCGTLTINEFYGGFLDYNPNTKVELFLPFIGFQKLNIDDVMDALIRIHYMINIITGECVAEVKSTKLNANLNSVIYRFNGMCATPVPITHSSWTNAYKSLLGGIGSSAVALGAAVAGGPGGLILGGVAAGVASIANAKNEVSKGSIGGGSGGFLAYRKPYLTFTIPRIVPTDNQNSYIGIPSYTTVRLSDLSGYTEVEWINMQGVPSEDEETKEILEKLSKGVII